MKKVKNVLFRLDLKGNGIVNFDSSDQKYVFNNDSKTSFFEMGSTHNNVSYSKKRFSKKDDKLTYKICISSDCLRHDIFKEDSISQSPNIIHDNLIFYSFIASPSCIERGYLFADTVSFKKKSPITITDAIQTCDAVSYLETFSRSGQKNEDSDVKDNTFFTKEVVGDIEYKSKGIIDLEQLQFVSVDPIFDRFSFNPDYFETYKSFLGHRLKNFNSELGFYKLTTAINDIPEHGFKFSNENVNDLIKDFLMKVKKIFIKRKGSFAKTTKLEYKLVYDPLVDTFEKEDGWIEINSEKDIVDIDVENYYVEHDTEKALELRAKLNSEYEKNKKLKAEKKAEKSAAKKGVKESEVKESE